MSKTSKRYKIRANKNVDGIFFLFVKANKNVCRAKKKGPNKKINRKNLYKIQKNCLKVFNVPRYIKILLVSLQLMYARFIITSNSPQLSSVGVNN